MQVKRKMKQKKAEGNFFVSIFFLVILYQISGLD